MADFFTHFSCLLDVGTPDNAARALDLYNKLSEEGASEEPPSDGFLLSIQPEHGGTKLWMRDDVTGDPERLIQFVQRCAAAFGLTGRWGSNTPTPARGRASTRVAAARMCSIPLPAKRWPGPTPAAGSPTSSTEVIPMPEILETTVYRLGELSDSAKQKARSWYREIGFEPDWHEFVFDDFARIGEILGLTFKTRPVPLYGGGSRQEPRIWFSGFWSQGDGACFEAYYRYRKGAPKALRDYAPHDEALRRIADALQTVQQRNFFQLRAEATHGGRYYHEYCMSVSVDRDSPTWQPMTDGAAEAVTEALRDLARWLYRQLEREYDHFTSDEAIDESIAANNYTFTEAGRRFG